MPWKSVKSFNKSEQVLVSRKCKISIGYLAKQLQSILSLHNKNDEKKNMKLLQTQICEKKDKQSTSISPSRHAWIDRPFLLRFPRDWNGSSWRPKSPPPKHPTTLSAHLRDGTNEERPLPNPPVEATKVRFGGKKNGTNQKIRRISSLKLSQNLWVNHDRPEIWKNHEHLNVNMDLSGLLPLSQAWDFANETGNVSCLVLMYLNGICSILYMYVQYIIYIYISYISGKRGFWKKS